LADVFKRLIKRTFDERDSNMSLWYIKIRIENQLWDVITEI